MTSASSHDWVGEEAAGGTRAGRMLSIIRKNLFGSVFDSVLTLVFAYLIVKAGIAFYDWAIVDAVWDAADRRECTRKSSDGACWAGVMAWWRLLIYGPYPVDERWRINIAFVLLLCWIAPLCSTRVTAKAATAISAILVYPWAATYLLYGGQKGAIGNAVIAIALATFAAVCANTASEISRGKRLDASLADLGGRRVPAEHRHYLIAGFALFLFLVAWSVVSWIQLPIVRTDRWGGLVVTLTIAGIGISTALPAGVLLALGRRSEMPIIRWGCIGFIELFRSVPLITVLFMATTMIPLFLPAGANFDKLLRAIVAICLYNFAYMAEVIRGGLQSIPSGQFEAAKAIGLGYWSMMRLVVLPQALRSMIPNIVNTFISLFKDTTVVVLVGVFDLLGIVRALTESSDWLGLTSEAYFVAAVIYFLFCFSMSRYSARVARRLNSGGSP